MYHNDFQQNIIFRRKLDELKCSKISDNEKKNTNHHMLKTQNSRQLATATYPGGDECTGKTNSGVGIVGQAWGWKFLCSS